MKKLSILLLLFFCTLQGIAQIQVTVAEAKNHIGEECIISGKVIEVSTNYKGHIFINFGAEFPHHTFHIVIYAQNVEKFSRDLQALEGKTIKVKGKISESYNKPQMKLFEDSIEIVEKG